MRGKRAVLNAGGVQPAQSVGLGDEAGGAAASGAVEAAKSLGVSVPVVVRLEGTNVDLGKKLLDESGKKIITAIGLTDADYAEAGATVLPDADAVFASSDLIDRLGIRTCAETGVVEQHQSLPIDPFTPIADHPTPAAVVTSRLRRDHREAVGTAARGIDLPEAHGTRDGAKE